MNRTSARLLHRPIYNTANKKQFARPIRDPLLMEENDTDGLIALYAQGLRVRSPDREFPIVLNTDLTTTACTRIPRVLFRTH